MPKNVRVDVTTSQIYHNTAALLSRLRQTDHLSPGDRAMASVYSSVIDRREMRPAANAPAQHSGR